MNQTATKCLISKQEANVILAGLDLHYCTEIIENISISNSRAVRTSKKGSDVLESHSFIRQYTNRKVEYESNSLEEYYFITKNGLKPDENQRLKFPHFIGLGGSPCFPVSENYARHVLIVHRPWRVYPKDIKWIEEFNDFINSPNCPVAARLPYERVMQRYYENMTNYEPTSSSMDHSKNPISEEDENLLLLHGQKGDSEWDMDSDLIEKANRGINYQWDKEPMVS
jgi:hypothetical protein